ncbi:MAG: OPT family oligopeptide transporter, partial [Vicinamibacteria bacterium]
MKDSKKTEDGATHKPFVPENMQMTEFTYRAVILGLVMTVILGAANAYLGLRAGVTIAATYPAAVISMAVLRFFKGGSVLEENLARTAGSIGESVAAGAVFTIPAFVIAGAWPSFAPEDAYWKSTSLMVLGSFLGVLFISLVRRVMVEDKELPYPESVAASEIHKAGQRGAQAAKYLFYNMALGASIFFLGAIRLFAPDRDFFVRMGEAGRSLVRLDGQQSVGTGGVTVFAAPSISPAYIGVGYIIGPRLAALNFSGGVLAWGLLVPLLMYFLGPQLQTYLPPEAGTEDWQALASSVWRFIVRPIAVGGMLVGAAYTLFRMRKNLTGGLKRAIDEMRGSAAPSKTGRLERYMSSKTVFGLIAVVFVMMAGLYV